MFGEATAEQDELENYEERTPFSVSIFKIRRCGTREGDFGLGHEYIQRNELNNTSVSQPFTLISTEYLFFLRILPSAVGESIKLGHSDRRLISTALHERIIFYRLQTRSERGIKCAVNKSMNRGIIIEHYDSEFG